MSSNNSISDTKPDSLLQHFLNGLIETFNSKGKIISLNKGDVLIREGEIENHIYFVESGAIRAFYLTEFEEQIIRFGYEGSIMNSLSSFYKETPSEFYIDAIRKTKLKSINRKELNSIISKNEENKLGYIQLLELLVTQQIDREIDLLITSPNERLERVLKRSPNLFQHVPLKYIASYLRMSPETLSRIRKS